MNVIFKGRKVEITKLEWQCDPVDSYASEAQYEDPVLLDYGARSWLNDEELDALNEECAAEIQDECRLRQAGG